MLQMREARQRNSLNRVLCVREYDSNEFRVTLEEWSPEQINRLAYYTDDLEDACLTGAAMRRETHKKAH